LLFELFKFKFVQLIVVLQFIFFIEFIMLKQLFQFELVQLVVFIIVLFFLLLKFQLFVELFFF